MTSDIDALFRGIERGISEHKLKALYLLVVIRHFASQAAVNTPHQLALPDGLFGLACRQGDDSVWILALLITARGYSIPIRH